MRRLNGMKTSFTLILPVHNEEAILEKNAVAIHAYLASLASTPSFEIILACNGCTDRSEKISASLARAYPNIRHMSIEGRGLGNAIKQAALAASSDMMMFYAVDLPFGLNIIGESIDAALANNRAVVIGSKGHRASVVKRGLARGIFSGTISVLNRLFFGLGVKDTQGSILFYKAPFDRYARQMDDPGAFFQAQLLMSHPAVTTELASQVAAAHLQRSYGLAACGDTRSPQRGAAFHPVQPRRGRAQVPAGDTSREGKAQGA